MIYRLEKQESSLNSTYIAASFRHFNAARVIVAPISGRRKEMKNKNKNIIKELFHKLKQYVSLFRKGDIFTKTSFIFLGLSNVIRGQIIKGLLYFILEISFVVFMIQGGAAGLSNLITLGSQEQGMAFNEKSGIYEISRGDNSMLMLLYGVVVLVVIIFFLLLWRSAVKSAYEVQIRKENNRKIPGIREEIRALFDSNIHKSLMVIPIAGLVLFTVVPLVYMILMAFTNYDVNHQPPGKLFNWVGISNFKALLTSTSAIGQTFWPILGWTMIWAVFATFTNYFGGMLLAVLINMKSINYKKFWRTVFVITIAVPSFVTLLIIRIMLAEHGALNILLQELGFLSAPLPFFTNATWARISVIVINMWIGIPHTMLITTGILMNIPSDLYESAKIDGAGPVKTYTKITMPYMLFVTTPYLITNFIANINNFNVIYFLTGGGPATLDYFKGAGKTDLLVTWLYKLTVDSKDYSYASAIGILIFMISATFSLLLYRRTGAYKNEEGFQ